MIALLLVVAMLGAVLVFEAGSAVERRRCRRRNRRLAEHMQSSLERRLRAAHEHGGAW